MLRTALVCLLSLSAAPALAEGFATVTDKSRFLTLVEGRELRIGTLGLTLRVTPDGRIEGSALGRQVSGQWQWQGGYFCREMRWGQRGIPYNCQLVEAQGDRVLRFTVDQGRGDSADFRLR